jgi:hypothetical protein
LPAADFPAISRARTEPGREHLARLENRGHLGMVRSDIVNIGRTCHRLTEIVQATEDSYPDED